MSARVIAETAAFSARIPPKLSSRIPSGAGPREQPEPRSRCVET